MQWLIYSVSMYISGEPSARNSSYRQKIFGKMEILALQPNLRDTARIESWIIRNSVL